VWLEYLFWVAYQNTEQQDLERIVVCKDAVIHFANIHAQQAHEYLAQWFEFWKHAQQYPVLLPAALVLKMTDKKEKKDKNFDKNLFFTLEMIKKNRASSEF
jgi:exodeoxyribonuclease V gamma subunit